MYLSQAVLCIENCASMLVRRYVVGIQQVQFSKNSVLCMNELLKLMFCLAVVASTKGTGTVSHLSLVVKRSGLMVIPAVVYLVVNLISYPSLERINASVFTAISQLKVRILYC